MKVLSKALIKESEEIAVKSGTFSSLELMENAGKSATDIITSEFCVNGKSVAVICGNGNNGGDGFVIARQLYECGADVTVITPFGEPITENSRHYYSYLSPIKKLTNLTENEEYDYIIDAMFGIGLNRPLNPNAERAINLCNQKSGIKIAIDIPSGVEADTGKVFSTAFNADLTITFIALKPCFMLPSGSDYCGRVIVADIGVKPNGYSFTTNEKPVFKDRAHNSHKGTYGTALLICGSYGMAGAAILSCKAALRSGVGITKSVVCKDIYAPFTCAVPEAVCIPCMQSENGVLDTDSLDFLTVAQHCNALLIGCGLGKSKGITQLIENLILNINIPMVIDADGINNLCGSIELLKKSKATVILTPHPGEMARLMNTTIQKIEADRINTARSFSTEYGCILVLKGADTIIAFPNGEIVINTNGNPGMATGGSGDVLSGIIVSLLAQGYSPEFATKAAVFLHGEAGDKAAAKKGQRQMIASDIIDEL